MLILLWFPPSQAVTGGHGQEAAECRGYVIICKWGPLCVINSFPAVRKGIREEEQYKIGTF